MNMHYVRLPALLLTALCLAPACQAAQGANFPADLMFGGQALDPVCIDVAGEPFDLPRQIDPLTCRTDDFVYTDAATPRAPDPQTGAVTVDYQDAQEGASMRPPFVSYRPIGTLDDGHAVLVESSGGGTGVFSGIWLLRRSGDKIEIFDGFGGGDRCNGGIEDAHVADGQVKMSARATPYDLAALGIIEGAESEPPFNAYDDLEACAICCAGTIEYADGVAVGMTLDKDAMKDAAESAETAPDMPMQGCFNGLARDYIAQGKTALDMNAAHTFSADFIARCVKR